MEINDDQMFFSNGKRYVSASSNASKTVRDLVRVAAEAGGSNMGALFLLDEDNKALKPAVMVNLPEAYISGCGDIPLGQQCCGRAVLHKMPWHVEDIWNSALFSDENRTVETQEGDSLLGNRDILFEPESRAVCQAQEIGLRTLSDTL